MILKVKELYLNIFDEQEEHLADLREKYGGGGSWMIWKSCMVIMVKVFVGFSSMETV